MVSTLAMSIAIVGGIRPDCCSKDLLSNSMDSHICAIDEGLKLCRAPSNVLKTIHFSIVECLDDGPNAANGFIDNSLMACVKGFHQLRLIGDERFRNFKTEAANELRL